MSWGKLDDSFFMSTKLMMSGSTKRERLEVAGALAMLWSYIASSKTDGFIPATVVDQMVDAKTLARMCVPIAAGSPWLHRRPESMRAECSCMTNYELQWHGGFDFYAHSWLGYNPSKSENSVHKAKVAERRDPELKAAIRARDRDHCRFCGKGPLKHAARKGPDSWQLDHVDPLIAAGAANLVIACGKCNQTKGKRTPEEADMRLLSLEEIFGEVVPLRPSDESTTVVGPITDGPTVERSTRLGGVGHGLVVPGDAGPAGRRPTVGPPTTPRSSTDPNPYLRGVRPRPDAGPGACNDGQPVEGSAS